MRLRSALLAALSFLPAAAAPKLNDVRPRFALSASVAEERQGFEAVFNPAYVGHGAFAMDVGLGTQRYTGERFAGRDRSEIRPFLGIGLFAPGDHAYAFLELQGCFKGPWGNSGGLRLRGGWMPTANLHLGAYASAFAGRTARGEVGLQAGVVF